MFSLTDGKNHHKNLLRIIFCISNLPNPLFYRCIFFLTKNNTLFQKTAARTPGTWGPLDFPIFFILRYVEAYSVRFLMIGVYLLSCSFILLRSIVVYLKSGSRLTCYLIFLHFLQKYRCVPKIAFSADISIDIFIDILTFLLIFSLTFLLTFLSTVLFTFMFAFRLTCLLAFILMFFLTFLLTLY